MRAGEHQLPEKLFPQKDHGARLENSDDDFRILACEQWDFAESFTGNVGAEQGELSVFLPLLQAEFAFEQDPESTTGLIDLVEIGAGLGVDELHRAQACRSSIETPAKTGTFSAERQGLPLRPAPLANLVEHPSWF